jgi:hypothetical protein
MALAELAPLWGIEGIQFYSLQRDRRGEDDKHFPSSGRVIDVASQLHDLRDTAAAIEALDLVIAVDTAAAHVAGALGKPVWVLLPAAADFRWLRNRDDSPWYPTMRLFRQRQSGQWDEVVSRVEQELRLALQSWQSANLLDALLPSKTMTTAYAPAVPPDSERPADVSGLSRVVETRYGIMQYLPRQEDIARSLELYGEWLQPQVDLLGKLLRPGATALEAGSGVGAHVLALAHLNGMTGHVLACEEDPLLRRILQQNIRANRLHGVVTVMPRLLIGIDASGVADAVLASSVRVSGAASPLEADTIDELLIQRLDLIKLNEGDKARAILDGASETLWRLRPKVFLSVTGRGSVAGLANHVRGFGYRCWRVESEFFRRNNFNSFETDLFPHRRAVALVAIPEESDIDITADECVEL